MQGFVVLLMLWALARILRGKGLQERLLAEQRITNEHLRKVREHAAWVRLRSRFLAEHGMTIEEYGCRYGLPVHWLRVWSQEVDAATRCRSGS